MKLSSCKKLNWPKYQQEKVKNEKKLRLKKMVTEKYIKSYFLLRQNFIPDFSYLNEDFVPTKYMKKDTPDDVIEVLDENETYQRLKEIKLYKSVLEKIRINVAAERLTKIDDFYEIKDFHFKSNIEKILEKQEETNKIYFTLDNIYTPRDTDLFYNLESAKQEIERSSKNEFEYKAHVFLLSFSLFFLERLHSYFLDLLKGKSRIKIRMYNFYMTASTLFEIIYTPVEITKKDFVYNTQIISDEGDVIIGMNEKITETIKQYVSYIGEIANREFDISPSSDEWFSLYNVAFNAFIVYTLVYLYHIFDLEKIFDDFNCPAVQMIVIKKDTDLMIENDSIFGLGKGFKIPKNSLLENIIMVEVYKKIRKPREYLFLTEDNKFTVLEVNRGHYVPAAINFLQTRKIKKSAPSAFLIFKELKHTGENLYRIFVPTSIESLFLFYNTIYANEDKTIDTIYKLAHEAMYKESQSE